MKQAAFYEDFMGKPTWLLVLGTGILLGLLAAGLILLISSPPRGRYVELVPPPTPGPIMVDITGAVLNPGLYSLPDHSRLSDVVQKAGGLTLEADVDRINLAQPVTDGQKFIIPGFIEIPQKFEGGEAASDSTSINTVPLNINIATQEDLDSLPGIGPTRALAIIHYRDTNGPFATIDELENVPGIGASTIAELKDLITVK